MEKQHPVNKVGEGWWLCCWGWEEQEPKDFWISISAFWKERRKIHVLTVCWSALPFLCLSSGWLILLIGTEIQGGIHIQWLHHCCPVLCGLPRYSMSILLFNKREPAKYLQISSFPQSFKVKPFYYAIILCSCLIFPGEKGWQGLTLFWSKREHVVSNEPALSIIRPEFVGESCVKNVV